MSSSRNGIATVTTYNLVRTARNDLMSALFAGKDQLDFRPRFATLMATAVLIADGLSYCAIAPIGSDSYDDLFVALLFG